MRKVISCTIWGLLCRLRFVFVRLSAYSAQREPTCNGDIVFRARRSVYNTNIMNAKLPRPVHLSYKKHRKEILTQIILPVVLTVILIVAVIVLVNVATFRDGGDVARWAAVSTIWIVIPIMIGMLIFLAVLGGLIYLLAQLLNVTPTYTGMAQDYVRKAAVYIKRGADAVVRPIIGLDGFLASVKAFFGRE